MREERQHGAGVGSLEHLGLGRVGGLDHALHLVAAEVGAGSGDLGVRVRRVIIGDRGASSIRVRRGSRQRGDGEVALAVEGVRERAAGNGPGRNGWSERDAVGTARADEADALGVVEPDANVGSGGDDRVAAGDVVPAERKAVADRRGHRPCAVAPRRGHCPVGPVRDLDDGGREAGNADDDILRVGVVELSGAAGGAVHGRCGGVRQAQPGSLREVAEGVGVQRLTADAVVLLEQERRRPTVGGDRAGGGGVGDVGTGVRRERRAALGSRADGVGGVAARSNRMSFGVCGAGSGEPSEDDGRGSEDGNSPDSRPAGISPSPGAPLVRGRGRGYSCAPP